MEFLFTISNVGQSFERFGVLNKERYVTNPLVYQNLEIIIFYQTDFKLYTYS